MRITWRDAVTTVSTGAALVAERAYFHYDWPLLTSTRWAVGAIAVLTLITLVVGFAFDKFSSIGWNLTGLVLGAALAVVTTLGLFYAVSDYVVVMALGAILVWVGAVAHHLFEQGEVRTVIHA